MNTPSDYRTPADAAYVIVRLEEAGAALLSLPNSGHGTGLRKGGLEHVRDMIEAYGWHQTQLRPPTPSARRITEMDEAYGWLALIPAI